MFEFSRAYAYMRERARLPTAMLFFAVTSVTVNRKRGKGSPTRFEGDNASREVVETRRRQNKS